MIIKINSVDILHVSFTGHLVQIGQQTYLVPQPLTAVRQPGVHLAVPQYIGNPSVATNNSMASDSKPFTVSDIGQFKQVSFSIFFS